MLVRELAGEPLVAGDYVEWAVRLLAAGLDSQALRTLAGLDLGDRPSGLEAAARFGVALKELQLECPPREELLRGYVLELVSDIAAGLREPEAAVEAIHREVLSPFDHPAEFSPWCYLWEGLDPVSFTSLEGDALASAIRETARQWLIGRGTSEGELAGRG